MKKIAEVYQIKDEIEVVVDKHATTDTMIVASIVILTDICKRESITKKDLLQFISDEIDKGMGFKVEKGKK